MASCSRVLPPTVRSLPNCFTSLRRPLPCLPLTLHSVVTKPPCCSLRQQKDFSVVSSDSKKFDYRAKASMAGVSTEKTKTKGKVQVFDSEEEVAVSLAKYVADLSDQICQNRNAFTVVVSGGSLIKSLRKLVEPPYIDSVDWSKWHVFWVDERVVPKNDPESNYLLAYDVFLSKIPIPPGNVYSINDALSAEGAADDYEICLKHLVNNGTIELSEAGGFPKFDVMLLGMGPDGHVASLFPGHPLVQETKKWVTFIKDSPKPPPERITFTFPVINSSAHVALVVTGSGKADVVHTALGDGKKPDTLPVQLVSPKGELMWFLDKGAASKIIKVEKMSNKGKKTILKFDSEEDVGIALAKYTADLSEKFIKEKGSFSVVLSGGSLIETMRFLTQPPYTNCVDWSKWSIFWLDERVVPLNDKDSNYKLAYDGFLSKVSIPSSQVYAINDKLSPEGAADDYEARVRDLVAKKILPLSDATGFPKFDLMLLGMGPDGHVASLFPNRTQRYEKKRWVTFITDSPKPPPPRITFTFPVINSSSEIAMVITEAALADATKSALSENSDLPAAEVSAEGELTWFLTKDAASEL